MKQKFSYYIIKLYMGLGVVLPRKMLYALNHWLSMQFFSRQKKRRNIAISNLKKAFPQKSEDEILSMAKSVYKELSKTATEIMLINANRFDIKKSVVNAKETLIRLNKLSENSPNGIIYIMAHYGNWELLGHWMALHEYKLTGVVKDGKNRDIDEKILLPFRSKYGNISVPHKGSMLTLAKALKAGKSISLAIDQVVQPPNGIVLDFFGHQTAATKAIAALKHKYNPAVVPIFITRVGYERFGINLHNPVETTLLKQPPEDEWIAKTTQKYYDIIENQIKEAPEQWLWLYNRWKGIRFENA